MEDTKPSEGYSITPKTIIMDSKEDRISLALKLLSAGVVKFGSFELKSKIKSPVYVDFRGIISDPELLEMVSRQLYNTYISKKQNRRKCDLICGVPYGAICLAVGISLQQKIPMIMTRKELKTHGTKSPIEGTYASGQSCLVIEDVVSTGSSVIETVTTLRSTGLNVEEAVVILDREHSISVENLKNVNVKLYSIFTISEFAKIAVDSNMISPQQYSEITNFVFSLNNSCVAVSQSEPKIHPFINDISDHQTIFQTRIERFDKNNFAKSMFQIILSKQSNLCVSVDVTSSVRFLQICQQVAPYVCMIKTHLDLINDLSQSIIDEVLELSEKYNFKILEDRKFADIGSTNLLQLTNGKFIVSKFANSVTAHALPGASSIQAFSQVVDDTSSRLESVFLVAQMSSFESEDFFSHNYQSKCFGLGTKYPSVVSGFICQTLPDKKDIPESEIPKFLYLTPGISLNSKGDSLGQRYRTVEDAINAGSDIVIVGRSIIGSDNVVETVKKYQKISYDCLISRLSRNSV